MTDTTTPTLEDLAAQFDAADRLCEQIKAEPGQSQRLESARAERLRLRAALINARTRHRSESGAL